MSDLVKKLREERAKLLGECREINDKAVAENRNLTEEEQSEYDKRWNAAADLKVSIKREESLREEERAAAASVDELREQAEERAAVVGDTRALAAFGSQEYRDAYAQYLTRGRADLGPDERRALSAGAGSEGGFLIAPMEMQDRIIKGIDDMVHIRGLATVSQITMAESLGLASIDSDPADADWTTELATGSEDSTMAFGRRELSPNPIAKRIKVSETLLRRAPKAEAIVIDRLNHKFGVTMEKAYLTGNGASQPLGVFTASNDGISTGRDISTGNTTTAITADGLRNAKYGLKAQYRNRPGTRWLFHRDAVGNISKLKDSNNQYLWQEGIREGEPDRLLGMPILESEYAPNTFTAGLYVGLLGDFAFYEIVDALNLQIKRLNELYAESNQVGFIGRYEGDGMPVLEEAFARVKLAAA